jgi:hypothetical protein
VKAIGGHKTVEPAPMRGALKLRDACEYLGGVSIPTMHRLIGRGLIRPNRSLRHLLLPISELEPLSQGGHELTEETMNADSTIKKLLNLRLTKFEFGLRLGLQDHNPRQNSRPFWPKIANRYSQVWETEGNNEQIRNTNARR